MLLAESNLAMRRLPRLTLLAAVLLITFAIGAAAQPVDKTQVLVSQGLNSLGNYSIEAIQPLKKLHCEDVHHAKDKCSFVRQYCDDEDTGLLSYLDLYFCSMYSLTPLYWGLMIVWLITLFASIGVSASDFLTLNLAALSMKLRLSSTVAGVTLLALGNGSPDLFSTFLAMSTHSGSLAVGELIGAAGFITTVVAAATAIPRSFRVKRYAFVRDILCFAVAVGFSLFFLIDGHLAFWECLVMVLGYAGYVTLVMSWHLIMGWIKKGKQRHARARGHFTEPTVIDRSREPSPVAMGEMDGGTVDNIVSEREALVSDEDPEEEEDDQQPETREQILADVASIANQMRVTHRHRRTFSRITNSLQPIRPSLLGAAEFGSVLSSLEKSRSARTRSNSPHQRRHSTDPFKTGNLLDPNQRQTPARTASETTTLLRPAGPPNRVRAVSASAADCFTQQHVQAPAIAGGVRLEHRFSEEVSQAPKKIGTGNTSSTKKPDLERLQIPVPSINISDANGNVSAVAPEDEPTMSFPRYTDDPNAMTMSPGSVTPAQFDFPNPSQRRKDGVVDSLLRIKAVLFPQLEDWKSKSLLDKVLSALTIPIIMGLTLTVPIGEASVEQLSSPSAPNLGKAASISANSSQAGPAIVSPLLSPISETGDPIARELTDDDSTWSPYLLSVQILLAPLFCFFVVYKVWFQIDDVGKDVAIWCGSLLGLSTVVIVIFWFFNVPNEVPKWQSWLSIPGFAVAIAWISVIAGEVVGVLKAFQLISGFSEAILGLIVFAAGNSVSDLFANFNTARAGKPVMAFHACFGGPMLNILLGIGLGGMFHIFKKWTKHNGGAIPHADTQFHLDVGRTLIISGAGLLLTLAVLLITVWQKKWVMDRKIGYLLVTLWGAITIVNVVLETLQLKGVIKPW